MTPQLAIILTIAAMIGILAYVFVTASRILRARNDFLSRQRDREYERIASMIECPWPLRHNELAARPDWVAKLQSSHSSCVTERGQSDHDA